MINIDEKSNYIFKKVLKQFPRETVYAFYLQNKYITLILEDTKIRQEEIENMSDNEKVSTELILERLKGIMKKSIIYNRATKEDDSIDNYIELSKNFVR